MMPELELKWRYVIGVWWLIIWRGALGAAVIAGIVGFVIAFIGAFAAAPQKDVIVFNLVVGSAIGIAWMFVVVRMALQRKYRGFRLALLPLTP